MSEKETWMPWIPIVTAALSFVVGRFLFGRMLGCLFWVVIATVGLLAILAARPGHASSCAVWATELSPAWQAEPSSSARGSIRTTVAIVNLPDMPDGTRFVLAADTCGVVPIEI